MSSSAANDFSETDHLTQLTSALADARMLLAFATQTNRGLDAKLMDGITVASAELENHLHKNPPVFDAKLVSAFWIAYDTLAVALSPVSADSIRQTQEALDSRDTRGVIGIMAIAFVGLVVFVLLQAYVLGGTELLRQIKDAETEQAKLQAPMATLAVSLGDAERRLIRIGSVKSSLKADLAADGDKRAAIQKEINVLEIQSEQQQKDLDLYQNNAADALWLLHRWYGPLRWLFGLAAMEDKTAVTTACADVAQKRIPCGVDGALRTMAMLILVPLSVYVGPAVLGILGAATYVLRNTSDRLTKYSYVRLTRGFGTARIVLGAVGGMIGSVVLTSGTSGDALLKVLPAIGVPFLMGYAVEVFFVFLDKIVATFSAPNPPAKAGG